MDHATFQQVTHLLKAMSNESRLRILCAIKEGEKNVGELEDVVGLSQSALSQHLARLRHDKIVKTRRKAQTIFYSLTCEKTEEFLNAILRIYCEEEANL